MATVHGAVALAVVRSTTCEQCTRAVGERHVRRLAVHLILHRVRRFRPELKGYTQRDAASVTLQLPYEAVDGRVREVYRKTI